MGPKNLTEHAQVLSFPLGKEAIYPRQAVRQLLPRQSLIFPRGKQAVYPRQAGILLPLGEGSNLSQAGSQAGTFLPLGEGSNLSQAGSQSGALLPLGEGSNLSQVGTLLPLGEGSSVSQAGSQATTSQAGTHLPSGEASSSPQASQAAGRPVTPPSPKEGGSPVASPASQAGNSSLAGQSGNKGNRSGRQYPRHSARQRALWASQGNSTASQADSIGIWGSNSITNPPNRLPQGSSLEDPNPKWVINLSSKPLTPAQRSVLAKGPNFAVTPKQPPNLEYITTIEAACTKLSQQYVEELRAEVNRVLRSSHPPNPT